MLRGPFLIALIALVGLTGCAIGLTEPQSPPSAAAGSALRSSPAPAARPLRVGYLSNLTHASVVVGIWDGRLAAAAGVPIVTLTFHSGTIAMSALLSGELDVLYAGPAPVVNAFLRSRGTALRIIAGSSSGGVALVTRPGLDLTNLSTSRLATPGLANTQDLALQHFLHTRGLELRERGGGVEVLRMAAPDMLNLFRHGDLDGAWVPEPWPTRLVSEAGAQVAIDERTLWPGGRFATAVVIASTRSLAQRRDAITGFLRGHVAVTRWLNAEPEAAAVSVGEALGALQGKRLPPPVIEQSLRRVDFTTDPLPETVIEQTRRASAMGLLSDLTPSLEDLFDLSLLEEVSR